MNLKSPYQVLASEHQTVVATPAPKAEWQAIYRADPQALFHQSPQWIDHLCSTGGYQDISRFYQLDNGKRLILPLVKRRGVPTPIAFAESLPYAWGQGGILASCRLEQEDIQVIVADLARAGYLSVTLRPNPLQGDLWAAAHLPDALIVPRCAHVLDLSGGFEEVWAKRISRHARNRVRSAEKSGLTVEYDTTGRLIPIFYQLYEQSLIRWAQQQHEPVWLAKLRGHARDPQHKLQAMADALGDACRVWVAWYEGKPAAAIIVLQDQNCIGINAAMNKELAARTKANYLLYRVAIESACEGNCRYLDMGETGQNPRLAKFKESFGAVAVPYADYHIERLPMSRGEMQLRELVKRLIGFKDV